MDTPTQVSSQSVSEDLTTLIADLDLEQEGRYKTKLVHTDTKLFWRLKATYEFHFFEVVGTDFCQLMYKDLALEKDSSVMFLSYRALASAVSEEASRQLEARLRRMASIRSRAAGGTDFKDSDKLLLDDITRKAIGEFVVAHFNVERNEATGEVQGKLVPLALEGDRAMHALILLKPPDIPTDARVHSTRRSCHAEITALMNDLREETSGLKQATNEATHKANLGNLAVGGFKAAIEGGKRFHSKSMDASNATAARARWHKAIHRVLLQIAVAKYTAVIKHSKSCSLQRVDTPTRVRGNRSTFPATDGFLPISKPGAPLSKPSPLTDVVGFGSVTSVVSKRRSTQVLTHSKSVPLPQMDNHKLSPDSHTTVLAISPPKDLQSLKLPEVDSSPSVKRSATLAVSTRQRRSTIAKTK